MSLFSGAFESYALGLGMVYKVNVLEPISRSGTESIDTGFYPKCVLSFGDCSCQLYESKAAYLAKESPISDCHPTSSEVVQASDGFCHLYVDPKSLEKPKGINCYPISSIASTPSFHQVDTTWYTGWVAKGSNLVELNEKFRAESVSYNGIMSLPICIKGLEDSCLCWFMEKNGSEGRVTKNPENIKPVRESCFLEFRVQDDGTEQAVVMNDPSRRIKSRKPPQVPPKRRVSEAPKVPPKRIAPVVPPKRKSMLEIETKDS